MGGATQTTDTGTGSEGGGEDPQVHKSLTLRKLVLQEIWKPSRQQKEELGGSQSIDFSVYGERGVRLSDALDGNWMGLEGRDDRSLLGDERLQIILRLQVRPPAIVRTWPRRLTFPSRLLDAHPGNQR